MYTGNLWSICSAVEHAVTPLDNVEFPSKKVLLRNPQIIYTLYLNNEAEEGRATLFPY